MQQILLSAAGTLLVLILRDVTIISIKKIIAKKQQRMQRELVKKMKHHKERFEEWLEEFRPEEYGDDDEFTLVLCDKCDKLKKNLIENVCLECTVNGKDE